MAYASLNGRVDAIISDDSVTIGLESTVISLLDDEITLLRAGYISPLEVQSLFPLKPVKLSQKVASHQQALSPGQKYAHYRPRKPLALVKQSDWDWSHLLAHYSNQKLGLLTLQPCPMPLPSTWQLKTFANLTNYARYLYASLNQLDEDSCQLLVAVLPTTDGLGLALADRLVRAAGEHYLY
jgi:L-threonylcarbamoyladenylate synthase